MKRTQRAGCSGMGYESKKALTLGGCAFAGRGVGAIKLTWVSECPRIGAAGLRAPGFPIATERLTQNATRLLGANRHLGHGHDAHPRPASPLRTPRSASLLVPTPATPAPG